MNLTGPARSVNTCGALALNPNDAYAHMFYSNSYLSPLGRHAEAIEEMQKAIAIDPFSAKSSRSPASLMFGRDAGKSNKARAIPEMRRHVSRIRNRSRTFGTALCFPGKFADAITEDTKARLLSGEDGIHPARRKRHSGMHGLRIGSRATGRSSLNLRKWQIILQKRTSRHLARLFFTRNLARRQRLWTPSKKPMSNAHWQ